MKNIMPILILLVFPLTALAQQPKAKAQPQKPAPAPTESAPADDSSGERVNVERIKEKYWARGEETEMGVVQNRLYSKANRFELGVLGGFLSSDPFLSTKALGGSFGFHFNEYLSAHLIGWKAYASGSTANTALEASGKKANTNLPSGFYGGEAKASLLYGKLSLIGKSIIYYDFHFTGGAGVTATENGKYLTPYAGLGQRFFLSRSMSLNIDYRAMRYKEEIKEKEVTARLGQVMEKRTNWTHAITLGVSFFFGK